MSSELPLRAVGLRRRAEDGRILLDGIDLELYAGDRVVLAGPSGAGKTQLLRAFAMLDPIECGEILWWGRPVEPKTVPEFRSRIVYLQQTPALFDGSVAENLRRPFDLAVHRHRRFDRDRAAEMLDRLGRVALLEESTTADLSGGERQIVGLVRLLLLEPEILLLDEPTAALDPAAEDRVVDLLDDWIEAAAGDRAYVWVTHDRKLAGRVGRRRAELTDGRMRLEGSNG